MDATGLGLADTIAALRAELTSAVRSAAGSDIRFEVGQVQLEFNVAVKRLTGGNAGVKFWVVELGAGGSYAREEIQKVTVTLSPPVDAAGRPVKVSEERIEKP